MITFLTDRAWKTIPSHHALVSAIRAAGEKVRIASPEDFIFQVGGGRVVLRSSRNTELSSSLVFHRFRPGPRTNLFELLEAAGLRVVNSARAFRICSDKALQAMLLTRKRLPHPRTLFAPGDGPVTYGRLVDPNEQWVVKPVHGSRGRDVSFLLEPKAVGEFLETAARGQQVLQPFVNHPGQPRHHVRCHVVGRRAVSAGRLVAPKGQLVTNHARGGRWEPYEAIPADVAALAVATAQALGVDYGGVDLIRNEAGRWLVLECNNMPRLREPLIRELATFLVKAAAGRPTSSP